MPVPPYAKLRVSVGGGANQTGGIVTAAGSVIQLTADPAGLLTQYRYEIYDYPPGWALPAGWTADSNGVYFSTAATPPPFTVDAVTNFGKYQLRLTGNNGISLNPKVIPNSQLVDESTCLEVVSTNGLHVIGVNETTQFGGVTKQWTKAINDSLRALDPRLTPRAVTGGTTQQQVDALVAALVALGFIIDNRGPGGTSTFDSTFDSTFS